MSISNLLDSSRRALNAQSAAIRILGDNIANVNTPGYTRRKADMVSEPTANAVGLEIGTGVEVQRVVRLADRFLSAELARKTADRARAEIKSEFLKRAEAPFQLDGEAGRIGYQLSDFFTSLQDLSMSPGNIPLRTQVIQKGQNLAVTINETYNAVAQLQREADERVRIAVADVNRLTQSIAQVNREITNSETSNQEALTLRDQRDKLVQDLAEKVSFRMIEDSSGQATLYLSNGFALVAGSTNNELTIDTAPTFSPAGGFPLGMDGQALSHIVFNISGVDVDLTNVFSSGSGELAGLLQLRGVQATTDTSTFDAVGSLVEFGGRVEAMARDLLVRFNVEYRGPDGDTGTAGFQPSSVDLNGNQPAVYGLFSFNGAVAGNNFGDNDNNGIASYTDLNAIVTAGTVSNYASRLLFNVSSERAFAAARDTNLAAAPVAWASGDASNIAGLLTQRNTSNAYSLGALSENTTIEGLYGLTVSYVGGASARAQDDYSIYKDRETQIKELQQSFAGVNLDEEFAQLIKFQQAFQASSRLIRTAQDLTETVIGLIR